MQRNLEYLGLVLKISKVGEGHALVNFFVDGREGEGEKLITAMFYGLKKSKKNYGLRQFQTGRVWLYFNPVNQTYKVMDFQATSLREGLSKSLVRIWSASFASELVFKFHGNCNFVLVNGFLDGIALCTDEECRFALLRFLVRVLNVSGVLPPVKTCGVCGLEFLVANDAGKKAFFNKMNYEFYCERCLAGNVENTADLISISPESQSFLLAVLNEPTNVSRKIVLSRFAENEVRSFLFFLLQRLVGRMKTLEAGIL
ncbi:MAG: DNA repair protein RecO C-terminal domain-containing protein [Treponemataceae bacterium]